MTGKPDPVWRVELTQAAARRMRALPRVARRPVAARLEALGQGPPADRRPDPDLAGQLRVPAGPAFELRFLVRPETRVILVVAIDDLTTPSPEPRPELLDRISGLVFDARRAARGLLRAPAFTGAVLLTLAVGLGGTTTIVGLLDTVFRAAMPFEEGDRLVRIRSRAQLGDGASRAFNVTPRDFHLLRDGSRVFEGVVAQVGGSVTLLGEGEPEYVQLIRVSAGWADVLGVEPRLGRAFTAEEEALGDDAGVAMIAHALWESRFGADPAAIGARLDYDGGAFRVVGVLPPSFAYPYSGRIWTPSLPDRADFQSSNLNVVARLRPGSSVADAAEDADRLYAALRADAPGTARNDGFLVTTAREDFIRDGGQALRSLALAVVFLLLLVCANVANLFTARGMARRRELALRAAVGAGSGRLLWTAVLESTLLFLVGGALGLALVGPLGSAVEILIPSTLRTQLALDSVRVGPRLVGFTALLAVVVGAATGVVSARWGARADVHEVLRQGGRGQSRSGGRLRDALVVAELALALVLLVGAGALFDHFRRLQAADLGFDTESIYTAQATLEHERYASGEARLALLRAIEAELGAHPDVLAAGITSVNPLCCGDWGAAIRVEGLERPVDAPRIIVDHKYVTPSYFDAVGIELERGRFFSAADGPTDPWVVVVDEAFAERFWPGEDPLGRRVAMEADDAPWRTIVGVVEPSYDGNDANEAWFLPLLQEPEGRSAEMIDVMAGLARGPAAAGILRAAVTAADPALAVHSVAAMSDLRADVIGQDRLGAVIARAFAAVGLLLAALGLYGLLAYQVELRSRELGTRVALGADRPAVVSVVLGQAGRRLAIGVVVGSLLAWALNQTLVRTLEGVQLLPLPLFAGLVVLLLMAAGASTLAPTWRALRLDPARVLRSD